MPVYFKCPKCKGRLVSAVDYYGDVRILCVDCRHKYGQYGFQGPLVEIA